MSAPKSGTDWLRVQAGIANTAVPKAPACPPDKAQQSQVETWLQKHKVQYGPMAQIPIDMIDTKLSRANQARKEALVDDSVERFVHSIKKGEILPPIVVYRVGNKLVIVDGNNRHEAHRKAGSKFIPGYILAEDTPSETIMLMTVDANAHHGVTPPLDWRVTQANDLVAAGWNGDVAADAANISLSQLRDYQVRIRAEARAKQLGVKGFLDLPPTSRVTLGRLNLEPVFHHAVRAAVDTSMTHDDVREMMREIKAAHDEAGMIQTVAKIVKRRQLEKQQATALGKTGARVSSPKNTLLSALGILRNIDALVLARQVLTDHERDILLNLIDDGVSDLGRMESELRRRGGEGVLNAV